MADSEQGDSSRLVLTQTEFTAQLGRVLQFSYFKEKTKKAKQYLVELPQTENIGVLCSWYTQSSSTANSTLIFSLACDGDSFFYMSTNRLIHTCVHCQSLALTGLQKVKIQQAKALLCITPMNHKLD